MSAFALPRRRSLRRAVAAISLSVCALSLASGVLSCGDSYSFQTSTGLTGTARATGGGSLPPFLMLVPGAKDSTAFRGVPRVRVFHDNGVLETRQDVGADGTGDFAIELLEIISLPPDLNPLTFPIAFENTLRAQWQVGGFRLRDLDRAAQNYSIRILTQMSVVAGIPCVRVEFFRNAPLGRRPGHYEAEIDPLTGFVLAWREFDVTGQPIVESEYESFFPGGDVSDLTLRGRTFDAQPLDLAGNLSQQAGFDVHYPDVLPAGFEVISGEIMDVPPSFAQGASVVIRPGKWVRFVATDGIESITFVHNDLQAPTAMVTGEIMMSRVGAWEVGHGEIHGTTFAIAGRVTREQLRQIIESAF